MEEVAGEFAGKAKFVKVDIEEAEDAAVNLGVFAVPTIIFFKDGKTVGSPLQGLVPKPKIVERVKALVG